MTEPEPELCWKCKQPKPIHLVLRNDNTEEKRPLCKKCADEWAESEEPWPPNTNTANTN
jgi:protein-arginine kinase activator protein McsA